MWESRIYTIYAAGSLILAGRSEKSLFLLRRFSHDQLNFKPLFSLSLQLHELDVSLRLTIQQKHTEHSPINRSRHQ